MHHLELHTSKMSLSSTSTGQSSAMAASQTAKVAETQSAKVTFNDEATNIIANVMKNELNTKELSMELRRNWEDEGLIGFEEFHEDIVKKGPLMRSFTATLARNFSNDKSSEDKWGLGLVSALFLYFNCNTAGKLKTVCLDNRISLPDMERLRLRRSAQTTFINGLRDKTIIHMEFVNAPDPDSSKSKAKIVETQADVSYIF